MVEGCDFVREHYPSPEEGHFEKDGKVIYKCVTEQKGGFLNSTLRFCALAQRSKFTGRYKVIEETRWTQEEIDRYKTWYDKTYPRKPSTGERNVRY